MGLSIQELKTFLQAKEGATLSTSSFQDLRTLLNNLGSVRGAAAPPADTGQNRSGTTCTGHVPSNFPYTAGLSFKQIQDHSVNLKQLTCASKTTVQSYCPSRTGVTDTPVCTCVSRYSTYPCACNTRSDCPCVSRTDYTCTTRCNCAGRTCVAGIQPECLCDGRFIFCSCEARTCAYDCQCNGRTTCDCNTRSDTSCGSRTGVADNPGCTCVSRYSTPICQCDTRCSCNTEAVYS